jgi:zinc protease
LLQLATNSTRKVGYALDDRFYGIEAPGHVAKYRETLASLTLEEVNAAIRKHLRSDDLVIAMIAPNAAQLRDTLVAGTATPPDYGGLEKPAEILAEDEVISAYPLAIDAANVVVVPIDGVFAQ